MKRLISILILAMVMVTNAWSFEPFTIKDIRVEGLQRISAGTVFNYLPIKVGDTLTAPVRMTPSHIALLAAMNVPEVSVAARPSVALIATGDELVMPGENPRDDQIIASNAFGIAALLEQEGAEARILPIARDNPESLKACFDLAQSTDLIVTIGGASVGDYDLVGKVAADLGMERAFYKIACDLENR